VVWILGKWLEDELYWLGIVSC